jgi:antitoxin component of MazEF toxin-antitoxin module
VCLPEDVVKAINVGLATKIDIYIEGNRIVIEKTS